MSDKTNTVYIVCGPTAVGKTSFAIELAAMLNTEIISADSRQCFRELGIAVAKPSEKELLQIKHHFIDSHSIDEEMNAGKYESFALDTLDSIFLNHGNAVMVGGTGLYIKSFCEGIDSMPTIDISIREKIIEAYRLKGLSWLQQEVAKMDADFWKTAEQSNPQRLMRALEMMHSTGTSITKFKKAEKKERKFRIVKIGIELPREILNERINHRVDLMLDAGLIQEAQNLYRNRHKNALQTVGYQELFDWMDGKISQAKAIELIKQHTRQYAKRQMTWFRKDQDVVWYDARKISVDLFRI